MSLLAAVLLLWGFTLGPTTAGIFDDSSEAFLWVDTQSLLEPWANVTLTCEATFPTNEFQLIRDGWRQTRVLLPKRVMFHKFPLGAITSDNKGVYRCRYGVEPPTLVLTELNRWTMISNLVQLTGTEPMPAPLLSAEVSWTTPYLGTYLLCHSVFRGVTFLLRMEEDDAFLMVRKAQDDVAARFAVHKPGNYICSYRTHEEGTPSESSATVTITQYTKLPPPAMAVMENYQKIKHPRRREILACRAPRRVLDFQLRQGNRTLNIHGIRLVREFIVYYLNFTEMDDHGPLTCRYRLHRMMDTWSEDSEPKKIMWSDGTQPAPELTAEPGSHNLEPGSTVSLRCAAPKTGLRFGLQRHGDTEAGLIQMLEPSGTEAVFELHNISSIDSGNYSCAYMELEPPFSGSAPSELLELQVNGPPPRPKLEALWKGTVPLGHEARFRCHTQVCKVNAELVRVGSPTPVWTKATGSTTADLKLPFVGPQHTGNYSCRYTSVWPFKFESGFSEPVEVIVEEI